MTFSWLAALRYRRTLRGVRVLIWDIDGTLYQSDALARRLHDFFVGIIRDACHVPRDRAVSLLAGAEAGQSWGQITSTLTGISERQLIGRLERRFDKSSYVRRDAELVLRLASPPFASFRHIAFTNASGSATRRVLAALGIPSDFFEDIVTLEHVRHPKPHPEGFRRIMKYTGLPSTAHLMIGDTVHTDLKPAKDVGMKTCLIHARDASPYVDVHVETIHHLAELLPR